MSGNPIKLTIKIPKNIVEALRIYMATEGLTSHKQSEVFACALETFLSSKGIPIRKDTQKIVFDVVAIGVVDDSEE
jgi:hypothetical protein